MTFSLRELSRYLGEPAHLFRFTMGALVVRYWSGSKEIDLGGGEVYTPLAIERSPIRDSVQQPKNNVTITLPLSAPIADWWIPYPPSQRVFVQCIAIHADEAEVAYEWFGRVLTPSRTDRVLELPCEPTRSSSTRSGQSCKWCRGCPLAVYSQGVGQCNLDPADFDQPATLDAVAGLVLTSTDFGSVPLNLAGGYLEFVATNGETESRSILSHSGDNVTVNFGHADLAAALAVTAYPGCPGDWAACLARGNTPNYGGDEYLPQTNLFDGNPRQ
jgi:hypothetical protein